MRRRLYPMIYLKLASVQQLPFLQTASFLFTLLLQHGLTNLGNTCFFNAVMQCLAQTPYLVKVLDDLRVPGQTFRLPGGKLKISENEELHLQPIEGPLENSHFTFTPVLHQTLSETQNSNARVHRPSDSWMKMRKMANHRCNLRPLNYRIQVTRKICSRKAIPTWISNVLVWMEEVSP